MAFYAFWSSTWPSRVRWISGCVEGPWPFIWQVVTNLEHGTGRRRGGFIPRIRGGHLCMVRDRSGKVSRPIPVKDKDKSWFGD